MNFLKSFKLIFLFGLSIFFTNLNGMPSNDLSGVGEQPFPYDSSFQKDNAQTLCNLLIKNEKHDGITTNQGYNTLINFLSNSVESMDLVLFRQECSKQLVNLEQEEFSEMKKDFEELSHQSVAYYVICRQIQALNEKIDDYEKHKSELTQQSNQIKLNSIFNIIFTINWLRYLYFMGEGIYVSQSWSTVMASLITGYAFELFSSRLLGMGVRQCFMLESMIPGAMSAENFLTSRFLPANSSKILGASLIGMVRSSYGLIKRDGFAVGKWTGQIAKTANNFVQRMISDDFAVHELTQQLEDFKEKLGKEICEFSPKLDAFLNKESRRQKTAALSAYINKAVEKKESAVEKMNIALGYVDVFLGLASLIRESMNVMSSTQIKHFPISFVNFIPSQDNKFEMHIKDSWNLFNLDSKYAYHAALGSYTNFISPTLDVLAGDNVLQINGQSVSKREFIEMAKIGENKLPIYAQILLAHTFGIVLGDNAFMTFTNLLSH